VIGVGGVLPALSRLGRIMPDRPFPRDFLTGFSPYQIISTHRR